MTVSVAASPLRREPRARDEATSGSRRHGARGPALERRLAGAVARHRGREHERAVEARAEALGQPVVGHARRRPGLVVAVVGLAQPQVGERHRQHGEHEHARDREADRAADDALAPAREARRRRDVLGLARPQAPRERAHEGRQHGDRAHGDAGDRRSPSRRPSARRTGSRWPAGRRSPRRRSPRAATDARPRGRVGHARGVRHAVAGGQLLAVAPDDQQRVVDARAEPEHDAERRGERSGSRRRRRRTAAAAGRRRARPATATRVSAIAATLAEHERQHDASPRPRRSARRPARCCCSAWSTIWPVARHLEPGALADRRDLCEPLARRPAELGRGLVVLDGDEGDPAVARQLAAPARLSGSARRGHVRLARRSPSPSRRSRRRARRRAACRRLDGEDDVGGVARRRPGSGPAAGRAPPGTPCRACGSRRRSCRRRRPASAPMRDEHGDDERERALPVPGGGECGDDVRGSGPWPERKPHFAQFCKNCKFAGDAMLQLMQHG